MTTSKLFQSRTEKIELRIQPALKRRIKAAAQAAGQSVSEFVIEAALERADQVERGGATTQPRAVPVSAADD